MTEALDRLETDMTESKINELAVQHFEDQMFLDGQLCSELDTIKIMQRREYREWLMQMLEQNQTNNSLPTPRYMFLKYSSVFICFIIALRQLLSRK